jgi:CBS-domain-containing membrane protein
MTCSTIMCTTLTTVSADTTVGKTIGLLTENHFRSIPVVSDEGRLIGQFGVHTVLELSVPFATSIAREGPMTDISFMDDDMDDLRRRLAKVWDEPVRKFAYKSVPSLNPTDSLTRTLLALAKTQDNIAVVDPDTRVLVGIVSYWDVLDHLSDGQ